MMDKLLTRAAPPAAALSALVALAIAAATPAAHAATTYGSMAGAGLGPGASLNGAVPFPADNAWTPTSRNRRSTPTPPI